jgi:hypothetical protein
MRSRHLIAAAALGLLLPSGAVLAQDNTSANQDRQQHLSTPSKPVRVTGTVVKYTAGQSIVLRGNEGQEVTYPLAADVSAPADVAVGSNVILYGDNSGNKVARITMNDSATAAKPPDSTSAGSPTSSSTTTSQGSAYQSSSAMPSSQSADASASQSTTTTTQSTTTQSASSAPQSGSSSSPSTSTTTTTTTEVTSVTGTVKSYDAGRSITITRPDGTSVSYTITAQSAVPSKLENGKTVVIRTRNQNGQQTVERITYSTSTSPKS